MMRGLIQKRALTFLLMGTLAYVIFSSHVQADLSPTDAANLAQAQSILNQYGPTAASATTLASLINSLSSQAVAQTANASQLTAIEWAIRNAASSTDSTIVALKSTFNTALTNFMTLKPNLVANAAVSSGTITTNTGAVVQTTALGLNPMMTDRIAALVNLMNVVVAKGTNMTSTDQQSVVSALQALNVDKGELFSTEIPQFDAIIRRINYVILRADPGATPGAAPSAALTQMQQAVAAVSTDLGNITFEDTLKEQERFYLRFDQLSAAEKSRLMQHLGQMSQKISTITPAQNIRFKNLLEFLMAGPFNADATSSALISGYLNLLPIVSATAAAIGGATGSFAAGTNTYGDQLNAQIANLASLAGTAVGTLQKGQIFTAVQNLYNNRVQALSPIAAGDTDEFAKLSSLISTTQTQLFAFDATKTSQFASMLANCAQSSVSLESILQFLEAFLQAGNPFAPGDQPRYKKHIAYLVNNVNQLSIDQTNRLNKVISVAAINFYNTGQDKTDFAAYLAAVQPIDASAHVPSKETPANGTVVALQSLYSQGGIGAPAYLAVVPVLQPDGTTQWQLQATSNVSYSAASQFIVTRNVRADGTLDTWLALTSNYSGTQNLGSAKDGTTGTDWKVVSSSDPKKILDQNLGPVQQFTMEGTLLNAFIFSTGTGGYLSVGSDNIVRTQDTLLGGPAGLLAGTKTPKPGNAETFQVVPLSNFYQQFGVVQGTLDLNARVRAMYSIILNNPRLTADEQQAYVGGITALVTELVRTSASWASVTAYSQGLMKNLFGYLATRPEYATFNVDLTSAQTMFANGYAIKDYITRIQDLENKVLSAQVADVPAFMQALTDLVNSRYGTTVNDVVPATVTSNTAALTSLIKWVQGTPVFSGQATALAALLQMVTGTTAAVATTAAFSDKLTDLESTAANTRDATLRTAYFAKVQTVMDARYGTLSADRINQSANQARLLRLLNWYKLIPWFVSDSVNFPKIDSWITLVNSGAGAVSENMSYAQLIAAYTQEHVGFLTTPPTAAVMTSFVKSLGDLFVMHFGQSGADKANHFVLLCRIRSSDYSRNQSTTDQTSESLDQCADALASGMAITDLVTALTAWAGLLTPNNDNERALILAWCQNVIDRRSELNAADLSRMSALVGQFQYGTMAFPATYATALSYLSKSLSNLTTFTDNVQYLLDSLTRIRAMTNPTTGLLDVFIRSAQFLVTQAAVLNSAQKTSLTTVLNAARYSDTPAYVIRQAQFQDLLNQMDAAALSVLSPSQQAITQAQQDALLRLQRPVTVTY